MGAEKPLVVTLTDPVTVPGQNHAPAQVTVFRAREESHEDDCIWFFGLNIGPDHTTVRISKDTVRSVAYMGGIPDRAAAEPDD